MCNNETTTRHFFIPGLGPENPWPSKTMVGTKLIQQRGKAHSLQATIVEFNPGKKKKKKTKNTLEKKQPKEAAIKTASKDIYLRRRMLAAFNLT